MKTPNRWLVLTAVIAAFIPVVIDMTVLHVAVPSLTLALGASATEILWIIDIYPLIMAGLLVPMGTLGDRIGYRPLMLAGLCVFTVASVVAAFSPNAPVLIVARALLALGGSMIMPAVLAIVRQTFKDTQERATALGIWTIVGSAGGAVGPLIGGILLEHFWWGSVFLINVPVMLVVLPLAFKVLPRLKGNPDVEWKIGQALLLVAGLLVTVYAIKSAAKGSDLAWVGIAGVALLGWFVSLQARTKRPMLDLTLFKVPAISFGLLMAFIASGCMAGFELVFAQELQFVDGLSPLEAGAFMLPLAIASAISGPVAGRLVVSMGLRTLSGIGLVTTAVALAVLAPLDLHANYFVTATVLAVLGFALGTTLLAASVGIMGAAPVEKAGAAGALESTGYELGGALGITFFGVLVSTMYRMAFVVPAGIDIPAHARDSIGETVVAAQTLHDESRATLLAVANEAFQSGYDNVLWIMAGAVFLLALLVVVGLRHHRDVEVIHN